jgi:hypothetical protein
MTQGYYLVNFGFFMTFLVVMVVDMKQLEKKRFNI